jgi:hypothetical protein
MIGDDGEDISTLNVAATLGLPRAVSSANAADANTWLVMTASRPGIREKAKRPRGSEISYSVIALTTSQ